MTAEDSGDRVLLEGRNLVPGEGLESPAQESEGGGDVEDITGAGGLSEGWGRPRCRSSRRQKEELLSKRKIAQNVKQTLWLLSLSKSQLAEMVSVRMVSSLVGPEQLSDAEQLSKHILSRLSPKSPRPKMTVSGDKCQDLLQA
jgi:hypothetical protein